MKKEVCQKKEHACLAGQTEAWMKGTDRRTGRQSTHKEAGPQYDCNPTDGYGLVVGDGWTGWVAMCEAGKETSLYQI